MIGIGKKKNNPYHASQTYALWLVVFLNCPPGGQIKYFWMKNVIEFHQGPCP